MLKHVNSLKLKLLLILIPGSCIALALTIALMLFQAEQQFTEKLNVKKQHLGSYADLLADPLWNFEKEKTENLISTILLDHDITKLQIADEGGNIISERSTEIDQTRIQEITTLQFPITYNNPHIQQHVGTLTISLGNYSLQSDKKQFLISGLFSLLLVIVFLSLSIWIIFSRLLDGPLKALVNAIRNNHDAETFQRVSHHSNDEIGVISQAFNDMQVSLESNHAKINRAKEHLNFLYHSTPSLLFSFDRQGVIVDVSDYFLQQLHFKHTEIVGTNITALLTSTDPSTDNEGMLYMLWHDHHISDFPLELINGEGTLLEVMIDATLSDNGAFPNALAVMTDVTHLNQARRKLEQQANTDHLSGIANRFYFQNYLNYLSQDRASHNKPFALLFIDLDHFKAVNDTYGHNVGDQVLKHATESIKRAIRANDMIARIGGDEFAVILEDLPTQEIAGDISKQIIQNLEQGIILDNNKIFISASIGIAQYPIDGSSPKKLLQYADVAMYRAKEQGRACFAGYSDEQNSLIHERFKIEDLLLRAVTDQLLTIHFQPIFNCTNNAIVGVEALLRLKDEHGRLIYPETFMPIAEESGLIVDVGEWCIQQSCLQVAAWQEQFNIKLDLTLNISTRQFQAISFTKHLFKATAAAELEPMQVTLDVMENLLQRDTQKNKNLFARLTEEGYKIALDDFGTGQSALNNLIKYPISTLKIGQDALSDTTTDSTEALIASIINIGNNLNLNVIVEGVETEAQLEMLKAISSDLSIQGYYISPPLAAEPMADKLKSIFADFAHIE